MNRIAKIAAVAAIIISIFALGALAGVLATNHHAAPAASTTSVSSFNDGWATSKQDDCQQGFTAACTWLHSN